MSGLRNVHTGRGRALELPTFALDRREPVPVWKGAEIAIAELLAVPADRVHRWVVGGQDRRRTADGVPELAEQVDVRVGSRAGIRRLECKRVARAEAECAGPVIDGKDGSPQAPERPDGGQSVDERRVADDSRRMSAGACVGSYTVVV
jgi:hypothetical protein